MAENNKPPRTALQNALQKTCITSTAIALLCLVAVFFFDPEGKPYLILQLLFLLAMLTAATTAILGTPPDKQGRRLWINQWEGRMKEKNNYKRNK